MLPEVEKAFRNTIAYFIQRQSTVVLAMLDLRPDILVRTGVEQIYDIHIDQYYKLYQSRTSDIPYKGMWQTCWMYRIHGIGCELINIYTEEPIEWDAPNPAAFRLDWFWENLEWRMKKNSSDPYIQILSRWLDTTPNSFPLEEELKGIVTLAPDGISTLRAT